MNDKITALRDDEAQYIIEKALQLTSELGREFDLSVAQVEREYRRIIGRLADSGEIPEQPDE